MQQFEFLSLTTLLFGERRAWQCMDHCLTYQQVGTRGLRLVVSIDDTFALTVVDKLIV
jgi:hypothetical protein